MKLKFYTVYHGAVSLSNCSQLFHNLVVIMSSFPSLDKSLTCNNVLLHRGYLQWSSGVEWRSTGWLRLCSAELLEDLVYSRVARSEELAVQLNVPTVKPDVPVSVCVCYRAARTFDDSSSIRNEVNVLVNFVTDGELVGLLDHGLELLWTTLHLITNIFQVKLYLTYQV